MRYLILSHFHNSVLTIISLSHFSRWGHLVTNRCYHMAEITRSLRKAGTGIISFARSPVFISLGLLGQPSKSQAGEIKDNSFISCFHSPLAASPSSRGNHTSLHCPIAAACGFSLWQKSQVCPSLQPLCLLQLTILGQGHLDGSNRLLKLLLNIYLFRFVSHLSPTTL